ncbi:MAG: extracellular solute-binding protein, partial [Spirochaetota bacterium]
MNGKKFLVLLMIWIFFIVVSGFGEGKKEAAGPVSIEIWHTYSDAEEKVFNEETIPAFEAANPEIKVISTRMPYDQLKQQVIAGVAGNAVPDLMRMDIIWVPEFAKLGALIAVSDKPEFASIKSNLLSGPLQTNYYNGKYYGLPLNTNTKIALYNKEALASVGGKAPKTFDELVSLAERFKGKEKWGLGVGGTHSWGQLPWFWSLGGKVTDDRYTKAVGYLDSPESIEALKTLVDLYKKGLIGPSLLGAEPNTWAGIKEGNYLM